MAEPGAGEVPLRIKVTPGRIVFSKVLNDYDRLALSFTSVLRRQRIPHVFVAGYVALLFGRSRTTEDVDVLMQEISASRFRKLWAALLTEFDCVNTGSPDLAYSDYLAEDLAIRFARPESFIPNVEVRFARKYTHLWSLRKAVEVNVNGKKIPIGPLELQIAYKLHLGSDKDFEDARHLFRLFREHLQEAEILKALKRLEVPWDIAREVLGWPP